MCSWTTERGKDKERQRRDGEIMRLEAKKRIRDRIRGEEGTKKCWCGAVLSGHILYIFLISFYGPLAQIVLLQVMEMGQTITRVM